MTLAGSRKTLGWLFAVLVSSPLALGGQTGDAASGPPGTIGLSTVQMYSDNQPGNRGPLVVVEVWGGTGAEKSGIQNGDLILEVDGISVLGKDAVRAFQDRLHGPVGGTVRLTLARPADELRRFEVALTRSAYPMRRNLSSEPFAYTAPRSWRVETYTFPVPWSPKLDFSGTEDVLFAPNFDDRSSAEYHSLFYVWWVEGSSAIDPKRIRSALEEYFRGLSEQRGTNSQFTPDLSKVAATEMKAPPASAGATDVSSEKGDVTTYDTKGALLTLHVDVEERACPGSGHIALLFALSPAPPEAPVWNDLRAIRSTFRCSR